MQVQVVAASAAVAKDSRERCTVPQFAASYVIDETLAIDAGAIGWLTDLQAQRNITDIVLSHAHFDHIASLPVFLENIFGAHSTGVRIWCSQATEAVLREHVFNDVLWPNLFQLDGETRHLTLMRFEDHEPFTIGSRQITALPLDHVAPTHGFLIDDGCRACAFISDTREISTVWKTLDQAPRLDAVFLECSFPNRMQWLADASKHLTPNTFAAQTRALSRDVRWLAIHIKAAFAEEVGDELAQLGDFQVARSDEAYHF